MKYFNWLLILSVSSLLLFNCAESEIEDKLLFTYESNYVSNYRELLLLSDINGVLIDSATLTETGIVELTGPSNTEKFTFSRIRQSEGGFMIILSFFNVSAHNYNRVASGLGDKYVSALNISEEMKTNIDSYVISGKSNHYSGTGSDYPYSEFYASSENKIAASWLRSGTTPKFTIYSNFDNGSVLDISPVDFTDEMSLHTITSDIDWGFLRLYAKPTSDSDAKYLLGAYQNTNNGIYYPSGYFNYFESTFDFPDNDISSNYETTYFGNLPAEIEKLNIGNLSIPQSIENYESTSSNKEIDVIQNDFFDGSNYLAIWTPNTKGVKVKELVDIIREIFPDRSIILDDWGGTWVYEIDNQNYDQYMEEYLTLKNSRNIVKQYTIVPQ